MQTLLKYTDTMDPLYQEAHSAVLSVINNPKNIIEKTHEAYGDVLDDDVFIVWSPLGEKVITIPNGGSLIKWKSVDIMFPENTKNTLNNLLKELAVPTEQLKTVKTNMFVANMNKFSGCEKS